MQGDQKLPNAWLHYVDTSFVDLISAASESTTAEPVDLAVRQTESEQATSTIRAEDTNSIIEISSQEDWLFTFDSFDHIHMGVNKEPAFHIRHGERINLLIKTDQLGRHADDREGFSRGTATPGRCRAQAVFTRRITERIFKVPHELREEARHFLTPRA